jgi:hypothetical protein
VNVLFVALLVCAAVAVVGAEWPRIDQRLGSQARTRRDRTRRKSKLKVVPTDESDDFAASVERDLANLPTTKERDRKR